jgi:4-amino-4-deoxychorismate lyase
MCQFFETIQIAAGIPQRLALHNERLNRSRREVLNCTNVIRLEEHIFVPQEFKNGIVKCKVLYAETIDAVEFSDYHPRMVTTLKMVECDDIDYSYKYANRTKLEQLKQENDLYDEIIIIKKGFVTDTSFSNIVFFDGREWLTPSTPLLNGTMRQFLLDQSKIGEAMIRKEEVQYFEKARLINAMLVFEMGNDIAIENIVV